MMVRDGNLGAWGIERKQEGEKIDRKHGTIAAGSNRGNLGWEIPSQNKRWETHPEVLK